MLTVDRTSLDYNVEEEKRLRENIITAVVGQNEEVTQREAFNEQQVKAAFESQSTVLNRVKKGFEAAHSSSMKRFADCDTAICSYLQKSITARSSICTTQASCGTVTSRQRKAAQVRQNWTPYKIRLSKRSTGTTQPNLQRMLILAELEPYRHLTRNEVLDLYGRNLIPENELRIKLNFANFVRRFERENTNILEFGTQIPFDQKISIITSKFNEYASKNSNRG